MNARAARDLAYRQAAIDPCVFVERWRRIVGIPLWVTLRGSNKVRMHWRVPQGNL